MDYLAKNHLSWTKCLSTKFSVTGDSISSMAVSSSFMMLQSNQNTVFEIVINTNDVKMQS